MGLSPEITFIATSFCLNQLIVSMASSRILSTIRISATGEKSSGIKSSANSLLLLANTITLKPSEAYLSILSFSSFLFQLTFELFCAII